MTPELEATLEAAAVEAIAKIIDAIRNAKAGTADPGAVLSKISAFHAALTANNAAADAEEAAKFKP